MNFARLFEVSPTKILSITKWIFTPSRHRLGSNDAGNLVREDFRECFLQIEVDE